jgi:hypothetical protein
LLLPLNSTPFSLHLDLAPTVNIAGNPALNSTNCSNAGATTECAGRVQSLHASGRICGSGNGGPGGNGSVAYDYRRSPANSDVTMFGAPDYFFLTSGSTIPTPGPGFAWNHGGIQPEIVGTFLGLVGPGVLHTGGGGNHGNIEHSDVARLKDDPQSQSDGSSPIQFSDHTDIRPTILALLGLKDDYTHDGRVLFEVLDGGALPHSLTDHQDTLLNLARVNKMINAPVGELGQNSLKVSTVALASDTAGDAIYSALEAKIAGWRTQRDSIAGQMKTLLEGAAFGGQSIDENQAKQLTSQGQALLEQVSDCVGDIPGCAQ